MQCPTDDELRSLSGSGPPGTELAEHVRRCARCQERLESLTGDADVLAQLRTAWATKLNDRIERRIAEICRESTGKLPPTAGRTSGPQSE